MPFSIGTRISTFDHCGSTAMFSRLGIRRRSGTLNVSANRKRTLPLLYTAILAVLRFMVNLLLPRNKIAVGLRKVLAER